MNFPNTYTRFMYEYETSPGKWLGPDLKFKSEADARARANKAFPWNSPANKWPIRIIKTTMLREVV